MSLSFWKQNGEENILYLDEGLYNLPPFLFLGTSFKSFGGEIVASQAALVVKNLSASAGDIQDKVYISGSGRSPGGRTGNSFQYCCLETSIDRGSWQATVYGVAEFGHN